MKKKLMYIVAGTVVVLGIAAMVVFLLFTSHVDGEKNEVSLEGSWKVIEHAGRVSEDEYFVFLEDNVAAYHNQEASPYLETPYLYKGGSLTLEEVDKNFTVQKCSDNNMVLVEKDTGIEWKMIRCAWDGTSVRMPDKERMLGKWNVIMHAGSTTQNEVIQFEENEMIDYRENQIYLKSKFHWEGEHALIIESIQLKLDVYPIDEGHLMMIEEAGYVWELARE